MFLVNRRYQRKLVWTIEEKRAFVDSIIRGYPVPLILLADVDYDGSSRYEILDGMQRLNAIMSFIEGEYSVDGAYFDLNTMAKSKELLDAGDLTQSGPVLERSVCTRIAGYQLPLSIYKFTEEQQVDDVFRRINANGKHLSHQELRQAGATGNFADVVRRLAASIRGDSSNSDLLFLRDMSTISITSKDLPYGISVDDVFWVSESILTKDYIRDSRDEELIADLVAYIVLDPKPPSSSQTLDEYYGLKGDLGRREDIDEAVLKHGPENIITNFLAVHDSMRQVLATAGKRFNLLMFDSAGQRVPRYYQAAFLAFYDLLVNREMVVADYNGLAGALDGIGQKHMNIGGGGGRWSASERQRNVDAVIGVVQRHFRSRSADDPALDSWTTRLENLLTQSKTEQNLYDFKQGFRRLDRDNALDEGLLEKIGETLSAMANKGPGAVGYVVVGISEDQATAERTKALYGTEPVRVQDFFVTGIDGEARVSHQNLDRYFQFLLEKVKELPLQPGLKDYVLKEIRLGSYADKSFVVFKTTAMQQPVAYMSKYFVRNGPHNAEVAPEDFGVLFARFNRA